MPGPGSGILTGGCAGTGWAKKIGRKRVPSPHSSPAERERERGLGPVSRRAARATLAGYVASHYPFRAVTDGPPAHRRGPDRLVLLGVRPAERRAVHDPDRGHGPGEVERGIG